MKDVIDVSEHNGVINWEKVKPNISGAIIRVGYGQNKTSQDDKKWLKNVSECERLGIPYGVYLYSYAKNTSAAKSEAEHVLRLIEGRKLALPVYFDAEESKLGKVAAGNFAEFYKVIKAAGFRCGLYSGAYYFRTYLKGVKNYDSLWIASYGTNNGTKQERYRPNVGVKIDLWQYTSRKRFNGIAGNVDTNEVVNSNVFTNTEKTTDASTTEGTVLEIVADVMRGKYGNGEEREKALGSRYNEVQAFINHILSASVETLKKEVLAGKYGNGETRKIVLGSRYDEVQNAVNKK